MSQESPVHAGPEEKTWEDLLTTAPFFERITCLAITGKRSGGGGGWRYTDAPVHDRVVFVLKQKSWKKRKDEKDENMAQKYLNKIILVIFGLVLISIINHLLYF